MPRFSDLSLRIKLGVLVAALMAVVVAVVWAYASARLGARVEREGGRRAEAMAVVLASAVARDLDRGDVTGANGLLEMLGAQSDALYAVVRRPDGAAVAAWKGDQAPPLDAAATDQVLLRRRDAVLEAVVALRDRAGSSLQLGWSLEQQRRDAQAEQLGVALLAIGLFVVGLGVSAYLGRMLVKPIQDLTAATRNIVERGDLAQDIALHGEDEVGTLASTFRQMVHKLRAIPESLGGTVGGVVTVVGQVSQTARSVGEGSSIIGSRVDETSTSAGQMLQVLRGIGENVQVLDRSAEASASSNTQMAAVNDAVARQVAEMTRLAAEAVTSVEQITAWTREVSGTIGDLTASVEATSASMSEMDAAIGDVEVNASETAKLSAAAAESSREGVLAIKQTIAGIDRIRQSSQTVAHLIESLGSRLSHFGDIVVVIDTVAGQTNLLALNAAIIAAQAGEHGRGFAVVADEIKALATRTAVSTQEIRSLIEGIEEESKKAVAAVEDTTRSIDEGVRLGGAAARSLGEIATGTAQATNMMKAIASSTVEQARASRQVTTAIHRIAETILHINTAARDHAASSERVSEKMASLQAMSQGVLRSSEEQRKGAGQIASSVETISRMVKQLATAQREQTLGAEQVLRAVEAIKDVASGQSDAVRELESALVVLQRHAGTLSTAVRQFRA